MTGKKILVIEDNELNLKLVRTLLELADYTVTEADNAEQGITLAHEQSPDLILMDVQLPGLDGLSATKNILNDPKIKHIPVIAVTSFAMEGDKEKALAAGCAGYISKPIDTRKFVAEVNSFLNMKK